MDLSFNPGMSILCHFGDSVDVSKGNLHIFVTDCHGKWAQPPQLVFGQRQLDALPFEQICQLLQVVGAMENHSI